MSLTTLFEPTPVPLDVARRRVLAGGLGSAVAAVLGVPFGGCAMSPASGAPRLGFASVPVSWDDAVRVPAGYSAEVLIRWGEPVGVAGQLPALTADASSSAADQAVQSGMHHDGMQFYPLPAAPETAAYARRATDRRERSHRTRDRFGSTRSWRDPQ